MSKSSSVRPGAGTALVKVEKHGRMLALIGASGGSASKVQPTAASMVSQDRGALLVSSATYRAGSHRIPDAEIFFVEGRKTDVAGPWLGEADKVAWRDPDTGYECILMREPKGGYLGGYVAVPASHPLHGFDHKAIPADFGITVHGGLAYSRSCEGGPSPSKRTIVGESTRICHVAPAKRVIETAYGTDYRVVDHEAWWFGFQCNHLSDLIPNAARKGQRFLSEETASTYRDDAYVLQEIINLALQLKAIEQNAPMPVRIGSPLPPLGLEPVREA